MSHRVNDMIGLALAMEVAQGLGDHPEWLTLARENIMRWRTLNAESPSLLRCYDEWEELLKRPSPEIARLLVRDDDEGQRLRQSSPFAGAIDYRRVWQIKRDIWALVPTKDEAKEHVDESNAV